MTFEELMNAYHINDYLCNKTVYNNLLNEIKNNRVTPVIGSGLSMWAGYPSWRSFMLDKGKGTPIETKVSSLMDSNQFEKAMQALSDYYKPNKFLRLLKKEFSPDKIDESKRPPYQRLLPELFKGPFVTTNYDLLLERLLNAPYTVDPNDEYNEASIINHILNHQHFLIKLHGTVDDPTHLIITEESYNKAYGSDPINPDGDLPLPKTLKMVFHASLPLFLGCSLGADRASMVLQSCMGTTGYALVEMPWNPDDFDMADARFDEMNLQVIWYPHGQHEAVEVLINQLAKDMGIIKPIASSKHSGTKADSYAIENSFIDRESIVSELAEKLLKPETTVLLVHGVAGIGKTAICRAVYYKIRETHPDFSMPFVDIADVASLSVFWEHLAEALEIATDGLNENDVLAQIYSKVRTKKQFVCLDNFEIILSALDEKQYNELIDTLHDLTEKSGLRLLVSSRLPVSLGEQVEIKLLDGEVDVMVLPWDELMELNQTKLFVKVFGRDPTEAEHDSFRTLLSELGGNPRSIIITAQYGRNTDSINDLLAVWRDIGTTIPGEEKLGQNSLQFVIVQTWKIIKENSAAVYLWALHSYSKQPLDSDTLNELNHAQEQPFSFVDWLDGSRLLLKHGLTEKTNDGKEYIMHLALKEMFPSLGQEAEEALPRAFDAWIKVCGNVLERGSDQKREDYIACHNRAVSFLPQCFYLAERCLEDEDYAHLSYLLENADNFYMYGVVRSVSLLSMIIEKTPKEFPLRSKFYQSIGDLLNRTGDYNKALEAYDEAGNLYRIEHDNLGLANVLQSRGDLLRLTDKPDKATDAYDEAENLFRAVHDNLGLANVLQSRGDLLSRTGELEKAINAYDEAEKLYKAEHNNLGLANVLQSRGDLLSYTREIEKALKAYDEAEKLFKAEHDNHGLANILQSRGDLLRRTGEYEKALDAYDEAEKLYKSEHDNLGLANVLQSRGDLLLLIGKSDEAQLAFNEYKKLNLENQPNDYVAQEATKIIMDAMGNDNDVISKYHQFLDVVNINVTDQMLPYLTDAYSFLFNLDESHSKLTAAYDSELQEVLYQLFLIDCGKGIRHQTENNDKAHKNSQSTEQADQNVHEKVTDESSQEKSFYSTPSDLEKATELVLKEFVNWLSEERKQQGLFFEISIPSHRQKAGLQYGYDVGVGTTENRERFNLCFECKHYKTNMTDKENNKQSVLKVENYSYNLLQYYMHCNKDVNNRWILVSTYGDLQNDFPQKLFENWNIEHHYLKIFAITESSSDDKTKSFSNITCKEFLSVSDEAYKMVYGEYPSDHLSKDKVFKWLNETVIGKDWVEVNIQKRLRYSTVPLPAGYRCRDSHEPLLRIQSKTQADALNEILQSLVKIDIPFGFDSYPDKYGVFVIGEYGTGKTWLSCQTIEEIIRHPGKYPFEPFYFELKGILKKHSGTTLNKNMIEATAQEYVDSKLIAEALEAASKADASVFFLDGLDETLSGLSFTDAKISLLYSIMDAVRSVIPKSLFVVTSRESDYKACKNHSAFSKLIKDFTEIKLEDCTRNHVKQNIKEMAAQSKKDAARLNQLLQNESFIGIICRPVFYSFLSCIVEREEFARNSDEQLKEYDVLDEIIKNELQKMRNPADCKKKLYDYAINVTCIPDVTLTANVEHQEQLHEDTIAGIVPVGIFDITITTKSKPPIISFKHNIIREFLVAKYLYSLLKESVSNNTTDSTDRLIRKLKEVPMNVAIQKFFMESIGKDENNSEILHKKLLDILITVKEDTSLATKLLEILLLPGSSLCGTNEKKLNLTNLHAQNLYLWNCVLQNLDLRNSFIDGFQLINADLIDINFQGATIRNLQLCSDIPIVDSTCWHEGRTYRVVLLLDNGQLLQYSIRDQFDSEHIQVQLIGKARRDMFDGVFHLNSNLYLFQKKRIYSSQSIKLYELNSNCRILKIEPMNSSWSYLVDVDGVAYALFFNDNRFDCCCIGQSNTINIDSFCFISNDVFAYNQEGRLILQNHKQKITLPNPTDEISCFCGCKIDSDLIKLYLLSEDSVIILKIINFEETVVEKKLPIKMVSKFFKHVKPLNDWVLLSTDESSAYLIKLHESKCEVVELTSGVKCRGLMLGDGENEKRVEDDESYELLRLMNS